MTGGMHSCIFKPMLIEHPEGVPGKFDQQTTIFKKGG